jgi:hypothetical protein
MGCSFVGMAVGVRCGVGTVHHRLRTAKLSISYSVLSILERHLSVSYSLLSILERLLSVSYSVLSILERLLSILDSVLSVSYSSLSVLERLLSISFSRKPTGRARRGETLRFRPTEAEVASTFQKGQAVVGALWEWAACSEKDARFFLGVGEHGLATEARKGTEKMGNMGKCDCLAPRNFGRGPLRLAQDGLQPNKRHEGKTFAPAGNA